MKFHLAHDYLLEAKYPWFLPDKIQHLFGSAFLFSAFYFLAYHLSGLGMLAYLFGQRNMALFLALLCGFLWEVKDGFMEDGFSWKDLIADAIGVFALWIIAY